MLYKKSTLKKVVIISLSVVLLMQSSVAYAGGRRGGRGGRHHYRGGRHYRRGYRRGGGYYLAPIFAGFTALYYMSLAQERAKRPTYVVVPPASTTTVVVPSTATVEVADETVLYIPNSDGTYTQIKLSKSGDGYIGPQGEYYPDRPTVAQLRVLYGK